MEAIYWLAGIATSIFVAHALGKKLGDYAGARLAGMSVAAFWLVWTLGASTLFVGYALTGPLVAVQLVIILIAFIQCRKHLSTLEGRDKSLIKTSREIRNLLKDKVALKRHIDRLLLDYEIDGAVDTQEVLHTPRQHRTKFLECLSSAKFRVIILSGWATDYVVDDDFKQLLRRRLEDGVSIYIGYGYTKSGEPKVKKNYEKRATRTLEELENWAKSDASPGKLVVSYFPNHAKLLIRDDYYAIFGSFNWLSNAGHSKNEEISVVVKDRAVIEKEASLIIKRFTSV